jgi:hypothetical protein
MHDQRWRLGRTIGVLLLAGAGLFTSAFAEDVLRAPRIWIDSALADWATPVAGLNVRPKHYSEAEYYSITPDNYRTYPFYPVDREPPGYWEWLQQQKPEPLIDPQGPRTREGWIAAGEHAFAEMDAFLARQSDPSVIARARSPEAFRGVRLTPDGAFRQLRWVVTPAGVQLTAPACSACHRTTEPDQSTATEAEGGALERRRNAPLTGAGATVNRLRAFYAGDSLSVALWKEFTVPWARDERVERLQDTPVSELQSVRSAAGLSRSFQGGVFARANGSPYYVTKVPDLHDLRYSRYLDATATHQLRGPEDIARYAALVTGADRMEFGPHQILTDEQRRLRFRYADETLYAIGLYLMSLEPRKNPNPGPVELTTRGRTIFEREKCTTCHPAPHYTTGRLTIASGWKPPVDHPNRADIVARTVGTDPGAALRTRKGTGLYKIPSLRGVWSRRVLLHDGSLSSLEELFDPARLRPDYKPSGWSPPGVSTRAVAGHEIGLRLTAEEKAALIAFLRSL